MAACVALVLLVVGVRVLVVDRLWPETRVQGLLDDAARAMAEGRLDAPDGTGARQLFEAAQALDPDDVRPRAGLSEVADAALAQARAAVEARRFGQARDALRLAQALSAPRDAIDALDARLRALEAGGAAPDVLLRQAQAAQSLGRLDDGADAALPLYARVLAIEPGNGDALRGRDESLAALLARARARLREGDLRGAATLVAAVRGYDPGHVDLPDTQARMTEELDALRRRAARHLDDGRIERALAEWRILLAFDPDDAAARRGVLDAGAAYAQRAERHARDFNFADADAQLREARALAPDSEAVRAAELRIERSRAAYADRGAQLPPQERRRRVAALLQQAAAAQARGDLLSPPGDSAYDRIRAARLLAPDDPAVARASARLLPGARQCFDAGLRANNLARAHACLDARIALGEGEPATREARRRLAQRWLAIGDERLGAGNLAGADAALSSARAIDPAVPGHAEFAQRLRTASLSGE
ncbi:hypothetical protein WQ56_12025 [Luteimonas sp. FCS-9]|nr:hypothetical protein WQ56_12025 [Luteimonas sp. FCS-9]